MALRRNPREAARQCVPISATRATQKCAACTLHDCNAHEVDSIAMSAAGLFLAAYTCSGFAGLVYEVAWTRLLTPYMGHSTAAAGTVVAAFMGGLAAGAALGGRVASRLTRRRALFGYAALELVVGIAALTMPFALRAIGPVLGWAYRDGASGLIFPLTRIVV